MPNFHTLLHKTTGILVSLSFVCLTVLPTASSSFHSTKAPAFVSANRLIWGRGRSEGDVVSSRRAPETPRGAGGRAGIPEMGRHQRAARTSRHGLGGTAPSMSSSAWEDDMRAKALVSTEWLADRLGSDQLCILDVRGEVGKKDLGGGQVVTSYEALRGDFVDAHIPGAAFVDWTRDITDASSDVPVQLASLDEFASAMEEKGVGTDKTVVCYDNGNMLFATRVWWALTRYGHRDVRVLDGGIRRWQLEGRGTDGDDGACPLKIYSEWEASDAMPGLCVGPETVRSAMSSSGGGVLVDARSIEQFSGKQRRSKRSGRIPTAVSMPYKQLIHVERGGYLPLEETRRILEAGGAMPAPGESVILYCNGGVASTAVLFGMWQAGVILESMANYDGSMGEWGNQDDEEMFPLVVDDQ